ncbi:MAG: hypothetical protein KDD11_03730 [Acidobacteria bacterium]|nr:hypothetical protein [Acidobacteriota bacterium]
MSITTRLTVFAALLVACVAPASATSYRWIDDEVLVDDAALIAEVEVLSSEPSPASPRPATDYLLQVDEVLKGSVPGSVVVVRVPGGVRPGGLGLKIWGAPEFRTGDRALLMLTPRQDGTYGILDLMLGTFRPFTSDGHKLALRDLSEAVEIPSPGQTPQAASRVRDYQAFTRWVRDRAAGEERSADYFVDMPQPKVQSVQDAFTLFVNGGKNMRWFEFGDGQTVEWRSNAAGQQGLSGGGVREVRESLNTWNRASGADIRLSYAGTTGATQGLTDFDDINTVLFNDPNSEVDGNCVRGGVLAVGGPWFDPGFTGQWQGRTYIRILGADVVTNDGGSGCGFGDSTYFQAVITHEIGHTLGIGHSCDNDPSAGVPLCSTDPVLDDAIMRATAHPAGSRGPELGLDDIRAARALYARTSTGGGGGSGPAAPTGLAAELDKLDAFLSWTDASSDETAFKVYRGQGGGALSEIAELGTGATQYYDRDLAPATTYQYQVASVRGTKVSRSSVVSVLTPVVQPITVNITRVSGSPALTGELVELVAHVTGPVEHINWKLGTDGVGVSDLACGVDQFCIEHLFENAGDQTVTALAVGDLGQTAVATLPLAVEGLTPSFEEAEAVIQSALFGPRGDTGTFESNVWLHNAGDHPALVELSFLRRGVDNPDPATRSVTVMPGSSVFLPNVLSSVFGETDSSGAIGVRALGPAGQGAPDVRVISRSFVELSGQAVGSFGQFVGENPATDFTATDKIAAGVLEGDGFISTLLAVNLDDVGGRVEIELRDALGLKVGDDAALALGPRSMRFQRTDRLFPDVASHPGPFTARFKAPSGIRFVASATLLEAQSEDQIYIPAEDLTALTANPIYVPRVVRNQGLFGVFLISQLVAYNPSSQPTLLNLELLLRGQDNSAPQSAQLTVNPGQTLAISDVMQQVFGLSEATGALKASWQNSQGIAPKVLSYAFAATSGGGTGPQRFGMLVNSRDAGDASSGALVDFGAEQSDLFKSSYGIVNLGLGNGRVEVTLKDGSGKVLAVKERGLKPQQHLELNLAGLFSDTAIGEGRNWFVETRVLAGGPVLTYLASINASGDIFFVPGRSAP